MDTFSIIQGIHFSLCSDAGKTYYIINTLYNAINIWCHKSASCLLGFQASGVLVLQSNRTSFIRLQQGRRVYICFPLTVENATGTNISLFFLLSINPFYKAFFHIMQEDYDSLSFSTALCNIWYQLKFKLPRTSCHAFLSFSPSSLPCCFYTTNSHFIWLA